MFEEAFKKIQDNIQSDMKDKFGLSEKQSEESIQIIFERFKSFFSEQSRKVNIENIKHALQDKLGDAGDLKDKLNKDTINDLINKVGLNQETAKKVKDFSFDSYLDQIKENVVGLEDKIDISGILEKIKPENLEGSAKDMLENIGKLFNKKNN